MIRARRAIPAVLLGLALSLAACSSNTSQSTTVTAKLTEFKITPNVTSVPAGAVTFNVTNDGSIVHEFVVLRTDTLAKDLPIADNEVNEADYDSAGEVSETDPGKSGTFTATLARGHYVLICNIPQHVGRGMAIDFTVQ